MKKALLVIALVGAASFSQAQISDRENDATTFKLGARPTEGTMALTFGFGINSDDEQRPINLLGKGDLLTGKKFIKDDLAVRAGIRLYKSSSSEKGDLDSTAAVPNSLTSTEIKSSEREYVLVPGIEKHFANSNFFDVYAGGDLYLGFRKDREVMNSTSRNGNVSEYQAATGSTVVGLGGVIGVNMFVVDLPISLGIEYGWNATWLLGGATHVESTETAAGTTVTQDYYTNDANDPTALKYSKLSKSSLSMDTNQNVRVVANIYFNK